MKSPLRLLLIIVATASALTAGWVTYASAIGREMNEADTLLNANYEKAVAAMPSRELKDKLKATQRAWVAFRDADVALHSQLVPESKGGLFTNLDLTKQRSAQLKQIAEGKSGFGYSSE